MDEKVPEGDATQLPFVAPCRILPAMAPLGWMRHGWRDMWAAPRQSLTYGAIVVALSLALAVIAVRFGGYFELLALVSGFILVAPVLASAPTSSASISNAAKNPRCAVACAKSSEQSAT